MFEVFDIRTDHPTMPLHLHGRRWRNDGTVASLLVYAPRLGRWFEGDELPRKVRTLAVAALTEHLGRVAVFAGSPNVRW